MSSSRSRRQVRALARALMLPVKRRSRRKAAGSAKRAARSAATAAKGATAGSTKSATAGSTESAAEHAARVKAGRAKRSGRWLSAMYRGPAGARAYFIYIPPGIRRNSRVPMLVALHGCTQSAADFAVTTRFNDLADRHGFVVVYPEQTTWSHQHRCWHWYESAHQRRGSGEPAIIAGITEEVIAATGRLRIDPARVYVTGLSAGGGMALVLAATYPELFAAVGVHSAPAYRSAAGSRDALVAMAGHTVVPPPVIADGALRPMPPTIMFQGSADSTVRGGNGQRIADQWLAFAQLHLTDPKDPERITRSRTTSGRAPAGRSYTTTRWYTARGRIMLELWQIDGLGHAWSGGAKGGSYSDPRGPRASTAMWRFFSGRRRPV
jgi:poly(hydroxyalkanoate) depolymerase family esterase